MKRRIIAIILASAMTLALAACQSSGNNGKEINSMTTETGEENPAEAENNDEENQVAGSIEGLMDLEVDSSRRSTANTNEKYDKIIVPNDEISDLQPYHNLSGAKNAITVEIYEALFDLTADKELVPRLAKSYKEIDDTHFQVEIYDYISDSEGNRITADDVVFSYQLNQESGYAEDFGFFKSVEAIDDYTVEFVWTEPITSLTALNSMMNYVCIVSEKAYGEHDFATDPVGTGPYVVDNFTTGVSVTIKAREDYWQTDELRNELAKANVEEIEFDILADTSMQLIALESGSLDYCDITTQNLESYITNNKYNVYSLPNSFNVNLLLNYSEDSPCSDLNLRLAIYYAIDNNTIVEALGSDAYYPCSVNASRIMSDYNYAWESEENYNTIYNVDLAKEYLEKSNYNGETLVILTNSLEAQKNAATVILGFLQGAGINAEISVQEPPAVNGVASDSTAWDLWVNAGTSSSGYAITRTATDLLASMSNNGGCKIFADDDELQTMIDKCNSQDGYSIEATEAVYDYVHEKAYDYGLFGNIKIYAFTPDFASFETWYNSSAFVFGACDYYLD